MINLKEIPSNPGCYLFKDSKDKIIYVGKAKNLVKRVKSYFARTHDDVKTNVLVSHIKDIDFVVTDSEVEALILENNLIKKYKPRYNIDLKDSKRYAYVEVTGEDFPRLLIARSKENKRKGSKLFGPFVSGLGRDYVLRVLRNSFKIRTCRKLPKKVCMRFEIGLCSGPCEGKISKGNYLTDVKNCEMILKGKTKAIVEVLSKRMREFSMDKDFERALRIRDQIRAVKDLNDRQKMERGKKFDEDFVNWVVDSGDRGKMKPRTSRTRTDGEYGDKVYLILFNAKKGILENKQFFEFDWTSNFLEEFLVQFYSDYDCPKEVVLPIKVDKGLKDFIKGKGGKVVVPKVGEKVKLLELVERNVRLQAFGGEDKVKELGEKLRLGFLPRVIECFDVSHLSGTDVVASMVQFRNGRADKNNYRKFRIRSGDKNDDYAAMKEVMTRRYSGLKRGGLAMPDLIVVDGGKGQLGVAVEVLEELKLGVAVIGLAKREEEVFFPKSSRSVKLNHKSGALKLLVEIRDEAHRFAISYQRLLRNKKIRE